MKENIIPIIGFTLTISIFGFFVGYGVGRIEAIDEFDFYVKQAKQANAKANEMLDAVELTYKKAGLK